MDDVHLTTQFRQVIKQEHKSWAKARSVAEARSVAKKTQFDVTAFTMNYLKRLHAAKTALPMALTNTIYIPIHQNKTFKQFATQMEASSEKNIQIKLGGRSISAEDMDACINICKEAYNKDGTLLTYGDVYRQILA